MFLVRALVVLFCLVMLLPLDPETHGHARVDGNSASFCTRYPKTCDASGEVWEVFKRKLAYGIKLTRESLEAQSDPYARPYRPSKLDGRLEDWQERDPHLRDYGDAAPHAPQRASQWPGNH